MISIDSLKHGNFVLVETCHAIYELEILRPGERLVRVQSTDQFFKTPQIATVTPVICEGERFQLDTKTSVFTSSPALSARVQGLTRSGLKWHYEVF